MAKTVRVRKSHRARAHNRHLYGSKANQARELRQFQDRYGSEKGRYVYGATVGKVARERSAKRRRSRR